MIIHFGRIRWICINERECGANLSREHANLSVDNRFLRFDQLVKKRILYLFFTLCVADVGAQVSFKTIYGSSRPEEGTCVALTYDGGFLLGGSTMSHGSKNYFVVRTDSVGDTLWTREYDAGGEEAMFDIYQTADSGIVMIGYWKGFSPNYAICTYVVKADANGNVIWSNLYSGGVYTKGASGMLTSTGEIVVCGMADSTSILDERPFLMKISETGSLIWVKRYSTFTNPLFYYFDHLCEGLDGNYVCGGHVPISGSDIAIFICDTSGFPIVAKAIEYSGNTSINDITINSLGEIIGTGPCYYMQTFGFFVLSLDTFGLINWMKFYSASSANLTATGMYVDSNNEIVVCGLQSTFPPTGFTAKFSSTGNLIYSYLIDTNSYSSMYLNCAGNSDGGSTIVGQCWGAHTANDTGSIFMVRTKSNGMANCGDVSQPLTASVIMPSDTEYTVSYVSGGQFYSVVTTELGGCSIIPQCGTAIEENSSTLEIAVYPNPATSQFVVHSSSFKSKNEVFVLINSFGQEVKRVTLTHKEQMITCTELVSGIYFYTLISDGEIASNGKLIKD